MIHYPHPVHLQPAYTKYVKSNTQLTITEESTNEILSLPIYPELAEAQVNQIIESVSTLTRVQALA